MRKPQFNMCNWDCTDHSNCDCYHQSQLICPDHSKHQGQCLSLASTFIHAPSGDGYLEALDDNDVSTICVAHKNDLECLCEYDGLCSLLFDRVCSDRSVLATDATGKKFIIFHTTVVEFFSPTN